MGGGGGLADGYCISMGQLYLTIWLRYKNTYTIRPNKQLCKSLKKINPGIDPNKLLNFAANTTLTGHFGIKLFS